MDKSGKPDMLNLAIATNWDCITADMICFICFQTTWLSIATPDAELYLGLRSQHVFAKIKIMHTVVGF
jgi:hypothetical protein